MKLNSSINYTVCNLGSACNHDNSETCYMTGEGRFQYSRADSGYYTALPCYTHHDNYTQYPSLDSSGRATSIDNSSWTYYPAISTYIQSIPNRWYKL